MATTDSVFDLPARLSAKADPALIAADERHLAAVAEGLAAAVRETSEHLARTRRLPGGSGQAALDRDLEVHRAMARLRMLGRFGSDLCLGRMTPQDGGEPVYVGRLGLAAPDGRRLLVDWRTPGAQPFFAATRAHPMALASRRRYRWASGRIRDYWDEVLTSEGFASTSSSTLDDESAFLASLAESRSSRMRDVLGTIQADQDAIIRSGSTGVHVVEGGPGTGKTVVALHRTAFLLHEDARVAADRGGVLLVGPSSGYLSYVEDVLPGLGEEGVAACTLVDLVAEGADAVPEADERVVELKGSLTLLQAVEAAVDEYERPPSVATAVESEWVDLIVTPDDWAEAFELASAGLPHDEARDEVWEELVEIVCSRVDDRDVPLDELRRDLAEGTLREVFDRAWPLLDPAGVVADLLSVSGYLERCAPSLPADDARRLSRPIDRARRWTVADLPLLDAARRRIGDPEAARTRRRRRAAEAAQRERMERVIDDLIAADDDGEGLVTMLRGRDVGESLRDEAELPSWEADALAEPFAHIVVDEAQELTDAEWRMLVARCPSRSMTVVGDRAQARRGFLESWERRLGRVGLDRVEVATLGVNYRTPAEVMALAGPVILGAVPDASVPTSIRASGVPVEWRRMEELEAVIAEWEGSEPEGVACVIGAPGFEGRGRVRSLTAERVKGLEFDLVVVADADRFDEGGFGEGSSGEGVTAAVDRYVAMTRSTRRLVLLTTAGHL